MSGYCMKFLVLMLSAALLQVGFAAFPVRIAGKTPLFTGVGTEIEPTGAIVRAQDGVDSAFQEQLEEALKLQAIGEYEKAEKVYETLLELVPADAPVRADASFGLGQTRYWAKNYPGAIQAFQDFAREYPADARRGPAVFLTGQAYHSLGSWSEAITAFQAYLTIDDTVASFVYEVMGDCYLAAHDFAAAVEAYRRGVEGPVDRLMKIHLLEGIADAQTQAAQYDDLVATYDEILTYAQGADYRAKTEYLAGQALAAAGKGDESHQRYLAAVDDYPTSYHAYLALIELVNANLPVDEFQRGLVDYHAGAYGPAVQAFDRYLKNTPEHYAGEAHYYAGMSYKAAGNAELALAKFAGVIEDYPQGRYFGDAWIAKGETLVSAGAADKAAATWAQFVELNPDHQLAPRALWLSGELWEEQDRFEEAIYNYSELQSRYPESEFAAEALYRAGLCSYRSAEYASALSLWQKLVDEYGASSFRPAALYWLGRASHTIGNDENAVAYLNRLQAAYPGTYYAVRGDEFRQTWSAKLFQVPGQKNMLLSLPTADEQADAEAWLLSWSPVQPAEGESVSELPETLAQDGRLQRGVILWTLELTADASAQIRSLKSDINDSPLDLYRLGLLLQKKGMYRLAVSCFERVVELAPIEQRVSLPAFLLKLTHPFHFSDLLVAQAVELGVDPLLLFALVRQESSFEWHVQSWAGAQGLMQVMPATADWIALQLGWGDFSQHLIYRPFVNVQFGTWYFAHQLSSFNGDVVAALVAYNAGPGRAKRWQTAEMAVDDDLLLEYLPLDEPHLYVEKVYTHYNIYRQLYSAQ